MSINQDSGKVLAPELQTVGWVNTTKPLTLASLRGKVVVLHGFQMLCPGCVLHGIPLAQRIFDEFDPEQVAVVGLHSVFEHHKVMGPEALEVFTHEFGIRYPIGIDAPGTDSPMPKTMVSYGMQGTPTLILIDKTGHIRLHKFGKVSDLVVGTAIGSLLAEE